MDNTMTTHEAVSQVIQGLNELIMQNLKGAAQQQYFPCSNPDEMDDRIEAGKKAAAKLRMMRDDFEDLSSGVL